MQWTPELDRSISELHAKRLGNAFIAKWLRIAPAQLRGRLAELGLANSGPASASTSGPVGTHQGKSAGAESDDGDDDDMVTLAGCPKGHLLPERRINAMYKSLGHRY